MSNKNAISTKSLFVIGFLVIVALFFTISLFSSWISSDGSDSQAVVVTPNVQVGLPVAAVDLNGEWTAENNGSQFQAHIMNNVITIELVSRGTTMTYWNGTFETSVSPGSTIVSDKLESDKMILSGADSKNFVAQPDGLSFDFQALGMTKTVVLTRA